VVAVLRLVIAAVGPAVMSAAVEREHLRVVLSTSAPDAGSWPTRARAVQGACGHRTLISRAKITTRTLGADLRPMPGF
jgi:hypothetical protein